MQRLFKWFIMLNKRLYKKLSFVIILALIPLSVFSFNLVSQQDSGFITIALAQENKTDKLSTAIVGELVSEDSIINYIQYDTKEAATDAVRNGDVDAAWIFAENLEEEIQKFCESGFKDGCAANVVMREQTVLLRVTNEKLNACLFKHCSKIYYQVYARQNLNQLDFLSDAQLIKYYDNVTFDDTLFEYGTLNDEDSNDAASTNYLVTPIRGFLAILVVLCGLAAAMYYMQDEQLKTFSWVKEKNRLFVAFSCILIAVLNIMVIVLVSLFASSLAKELSKELLSFVLYSLCCTVFCLILKMIFDNIKPLSSIIPLTIVIMIVICPVFFDFRSLTALQLLFPPTYYVNVAHDSMYLLYMAIYFVLGAGICYLMSLYKTRFKSRYKK